MNICQLESSIFGISHFSLFSYCKDDKNRPKCKLTSLDNSTFHTSVSVFFLRVNPLHCVGSISVTFRNSVITFPQWTPCSSWLLEYNRSLAWTRVPATRLLLLSSHTNTSGSVCWGCKKKKKNRTHNSGD